MYREHLRARVGVSGRFVPHKALHYSSSFFLTERPAGAVQPDVVGYGRASVAQKSDGGAAPRLEDRRPQLPPLESPHGLRSTYGGPHPYHGFSSSVRCQAVDAADAGLRPRRGFHPDGRGSPTGSQQ